MGTQFGEIVFSLCFHETFYDRAFFCVFMFEYFKYVQ